jgi:Rne/Rng family ribonuclease
MAKELIISSNRHETKVAMFEDEQLVEIYFQRADEYSLAGSIHKGRVTRVLPGMQSAFVNIGLERDAFLYVSDFFEESEEEYEKTPVANRPKQHKSRAPQVVDEDTGEPTNESNERSAAAQTVAELSVVADAEVQPALLADAEVDEADEVEAVVEEQVDAPAPREARDSGEGEFDERRGRRRRRRRGKGGSGLPESKFAEAGPRHAGGRHENRPPQQHNRQGGRGPRGPMDDDARWNRKPNAEARLVAFDDEDPPQAVLIAKVSDPNRLPPPRRDEGPLVLPGESLAKYRRLGEPRRDTTDFADTSEVGGRYSQPRKNRHGRAGFLAPVDEGPGSEEKREDKSHPAEGSSASLLPPDDSNPRFAVRVPAGDEEEAQADAVAATEEAAAEATEKPKRKTATKRATKTAKTATKRARKKASSTDAENVEEAAPTTRRRSKAAVAEEPVEAPVAEEVSSEGAEKQSEPEVAEALVVAEAPVVEAPVEVEPVTADVETDEPADPADQEEDDIALDVVPGDLGEAEEEDYAGVTEEDDSVAEGSLDEEAVAEDAGAAEGTEQPQRLSRRERRRLRMVERRDERRRERENRRGGESAAAAVTEEAAVVEEAPVEAVEEEVVAEAESIVAKAGRPDRQGRPERSERNDRGRGKFSQPQQSISEVLKEGQEVLVQIAKEPLGQKGARITSHIALPGRYVVYMPTVEHVGVSRKVGTDSERARLRKILQTVREGMQGGFICRTAAEGRSEAEIRTDMEFLYNMWLDIKAKADKKKAPTLIHHDLDIVERMLRDQLTDEFKTIWVDNEELYERILRFVQTVQPSLVSRVRLYTKPAPIFDTFNVTNELEKALRPKVWLKSGGYIVINQTEALVAIDVNTGKFVGKSNRLEDTIVKTNLEAVKEAVRQIRLRDLGGIIVVDFIDMDERKNRHKVMQALEEAMMQDRAPYKILQFNDFGLVAITRKRVKQSLERTLCQPCPTCEGAGYIKNVQTIIGEILTEAQKLARAIDDSEVSLRVHPEVGKVLKSHTNRYLEELEEILKVPVIVTSDPLLHPEKFDLA